MISKSELERLAQRRLKAVLMQIRSLSTLKKKLPHQGKKPHTIHVDVSLVGPAAMKKLNSHYRKKNSVTDILSFTPPQVFFNEGQLGELVICLGVLRKQAKEEGHTVQRELEVLLIHGTLHLLGFDHELGPRQAKEMQKWEAKILEKLVKPGKKSENPIHGLIERSSKT